MERETRFGEGDGMCGFEQNNLSLFVVLFRDHPFQHLPLTISPSLLVLRRLVLVE
ncbi:hypothetical protein HanRHA438_Chr08g0339371 [Helianthus annuus]|nr:hypothetical protein HanRHA438_Chr08g0339371 [Helianthus annuus]